MAEALPPCVAMLLWDVDPSAVDLEQHASFVLERVMSRGSWEAMRWLRRRYPPSRLAAFLAERGDRLAPRDRDYWSLMAGVEPPTEPGGGRPPWAGP